MNVISTLLSFLNIVAGLLLVAATLFYLAGSIRYFVLLGTDKRNDGLALMAWGVIVMFVLVVLLAIINTLQGALAYLIGLGLALFVLIVIVVGLSKGGGPAAPAAH